MGAAGRIWRPGPPGRLWSTLESLAPIAVLVAGAGGLGLLVGGASPRELLHVVYGALAFASLPLASRLARNASVRGQAIATFGGGVVMVVLIARLFGTG